MKDSTLKQHIGYWLSRLQNTVSKSFEQRLHKHNVTVAEWCVVIAIFDKQADTVTGLSQYIEVTKPVVSRIIDQLVKKGLVKINPGINRRTSKIKLSPIAEELVPKLTAEANANDLAFFGCLNDLELTRLKDILNKLIVTGTNIMPSGWLTKGERKMVNKEQVLKIIKLAKEEAWPFPKTFDSLKEAGVVSYAVSWQNGKYHSQFNLADNSSLAGEKIASLEDIKIADEYLENKAKNALLTHQQGKTSFVEWVLEMANAGVASYLVKMSDRTVHYFSFDSSQSFVEVVPTFD